MVRFNRWRTHLVYPRREQQGDDAFVVGAFKLSLAEIQFIELLAEAVRCGATKILIDGEEITGNPTQFERFLYGDFVALATVDVMKKHKIRLRFAYVIHEPVRDPERYGETVAVSRGMDVKTFEGKNEALEWLNGDH